MTDCIIEWISNNIKDNNIKDAAHAATEAEGEWLFVFIEKLSPRSLVVISHRSSPARCTAKKQFPSTVKLPYESYKR
jgi:hypothetical protein